jgi:excisionase family DNA binding protein
LTTNLLTIHQAAARLSCHPNTVKNMMRDGRVRAVNINPAGKRPTWRIVAASLEAFRVEPLGQEVLEERLREAEIERRCGW